MILGSIKFWAYHTGYQLSKYSSGINKQEALCGHSKYVRKCIKFVMNYILSVVISFTWGRDCHEINSR